MVCFGGVAAGAPAQSLTSVTVTTIPIANGFPMDLGIQKGFFAAQGLEIKKVFGQSGNDIVLKMANNDTEIGYIGYVPAILARTQGIPITVVAASETEGTSEADNWQNIVVDGSSPIRTPADLVGKTLALNALKGVGEVTVKAALDKALQATVGESGFLTLRLDGKLVTKLRAGNFTVAVADKSAKDNFRLQGAGLSRSTSVLKKQTATWIVELKKGVYQYSSDGSSKRKGSFRVT